MSYSSTSHDHVLVGSGSGDMPGKTMQNVLLGENLLQNIYL